MAGLKRTPTLIGAEKKLPDLTSKSYRMTHLYRIKDKKANLTLFYPNDAQRHFMANKHGRDIILKSRQLGFTTYGVLDMFDDALFRENFDCALFAQTQPDALDIFDNKIMVAWDSFDLKDFYKLDTDRANKLKFAMIQSQSARDKTPRYSSISVKNSGRGGTFRKIHVSEFGKICANTPEYAKEILSGAMGTVPLDGEITIESTAEGNTGAFAEMFWTAYRRPPNQPIHRSEFKAHFYNWTWDKKELLAALPIIDPITLPKEFQEYQRLHKLSPLQITFLYRRSIPLNGNWDLLLQEYPFTPEEAFRFSGDRLFTASKVEELRKYIKTPTYLNKWRIFDTFKPNHKYAISADPSEGVGKDNAAATIIDFSEKVPTIVATFKDKRTAPDMFAHELEAIARQYGYPLIVVERNNHGHSTLQKLKEIYPTNLIYKEKRFDKEEKEETERLGWLTNVVTKPNMLYHLNTLVNEDLINIPDEDIIGELRTYPKKNVDEIKLKRDQEHHWDLTIALAIGLQMRNEVEETNTQTNTYTTTAIQSDPFSGI